MMKTLAAGQALNGTTPSPPSRSFRGREADSTVLNDYPRPHPNPGQQLALRAHHGVVTDDRVNDARSGTDGCAMPDHGIDDPHVRTDLCSVEDHRVVDRGSVGDLHVPT